jgi:hypothetical protein
MERFEHWRPYWVGGLALATGLALIAALDDPSTGLSASVLLVPTLFLTACFFHQVFHLYAFTPQSLAVVLLIGIFSTRAGHAMSRIMAGDSLLGWLIAIPLFLFCAHPVLCIWGRIRCRPLVRKIKQTKLELRKNAADAQRMENESRRLASSVQEMETLNQGALEQRRHLEEQTKTLCLRSEDLRVAIIGKESRERDYKRLALQDLKKLKNQLRRNRGTNPAALDALLIDKALLDKETQGAYEQLSAMRARLSSLQHELQSLSRDKGLLQQQERDRRNALRSFRSRKIRLD